MERIILVKGRVKYQITLDPSIWIFDEQKRDLNAVLDGEADFSEKKVDTARMAARAWDRLMNEGIVNAPPLVTDINEEDYSGTYCLPLSRFLKNAEPEEDANTLVVETKDDEIAIPLEKGKTLLMNFSKDGKMLKEDGPVHLYFADGSNRDNPLKNVRAFRLE